MLSPSPPCVLGSLQLHHAGVWGSTFIPVSSHLPLPPFPFPSPIPVSVYVPSVYLCLPGLPPTVPRSQPLCKRPGQVLQERHTLQAVTSSVSQFDYSAFFFLNHGTHLGTSANDRESRNDSSPCRFWGLESLSQTSRGYWQDSRKAQPDKKICFTANLFAVKQIKMRHHVLPITLTKTERSVTGKGVACLYGQGRNKETPSENWWCFLGGSLGNIYRGVKFSCPLT